MEEETCSVCGMSTSDGHTHDDDNSEGSEE